MIKNKKCLPVDCGQAFFIKIFFIKNTSAELKLCIRVIKNLTLL